MPMAFLSVRPGVCGRRCDNPPGCFCRDEDHSARYLLISKHVNVQIHRLYIRHMMWGIRECNLYIELLVQANAILPTPTKMTFIEDSHENRYQVDFGERSHFRQHPAAFPIFSVSTSYSEDSYSSHHFGD